MCFYPQTKRILILLCITPMPLLKSRAKPPLYLGLAFNSLFPFQMGRNLPKGATHGEVRSSLMLHCVFTQWELNGPKQSCRIGDSCNTWMAWQPHGHWQKGRSWIELSANKRELLCGMHFHTMAGTKGTLDLILPSCSVPQLVCYRYLGNGRGLAKDWFA